MKKEQRLLAEMASVGRMCRGKVSVRRQGKSGGEYFVLQCWRAGGNRCRYVHPARRKAYEEACEGYRRFMSLAESYADIVIARTERESCRGMRPDGPGHRPTGPPQREGHTLQRLLPVRRRAAEAAPTGARRTSAPSASRAPGTRAAAARACGGRIRRTL